MTNSWWYPFTYCSIQNLDITRVFQSKYFLIRRWLWPKFLGTLDNTVTILVKRRCHESFGAMTVKASIFSMVGMSVVTVHGGFRIGINEIVYKLVEQWDRKLQARGKSWSNIANFVDCWQRTVNVAIKATCCIDSLFLYYSDGIQSSLFLHAKMVA